MHLKGIVNFAKFERSAFLDLQGARSLSYYRGSGKNYVTPCRINSEGK